MYVAATKDEGNAADGRFSTACKDLTLSCNPHIEPLARQYVANWLAKQFVVSSEVIEKCMQRDRL